MVRAFSNLAIDLAISVAIVTVRLWQAGRRLIRA